MLQIPRSQRHSIRIHDVEDHSKSETQMSNTIQKPVALRALQIWEKFDERIGRRLRRVVAFKRSVRGPGDSHGTASTTIVNTI